MLTGVYDIQTAYAVCDGVFTNTVPTDAYRGAGRPEAAFVIERLMDEAARVTGLSPTEIRRRNFIPPEQMPYKTITDHTYDTGEFAAHMDKAMAVAEAAVLRGAACGEQGARQNPRPRLRHLCRDLRLRRHRAGQGRA